MKKLFSLILVLTLVLSLATVASAEETDVITNQNGVNDVTDFDENNGASVTGTVTIDVISAQPDPLYYVVVNWDDLTFSYNFGTDAPVWNPSDHTYSSATATGWVNTTANIKVTNHSNAGIAVNASFDGNSEKVTNDVRVYLTNNQFTLGTADTDEYRGVTDKGPNATIVVHVDNTTKPNTNADFELGTITVKISPNP